MNKHAYLHCVYAEDVRQETSGQLSVIGIFQGGMRVSEAPIRLPKLSVIAHLFVTHKPASIRIEVCQDGKVLQTVEPPSTFIQKLQSEPDTNVEGGYRMQFVVLLTDFEIQSAARLHVRAIVDEEIMDGNDLLIQVGDEKSPGRADLAAAQA